MQGETMTLHSDLLLNGFVEAKKDYEDYLQEQAEYAERVRWEKIIWALVFRSSLMRDLRRNI